MSTLLAVALALACLSGPATSQTLTQAECFFDTDPGEGSGIPLSISEADCVEVGQLVPLTTLDPGFHRLSIRYRDDEGRWGEPDGRFFYMQSGAGSAYELRTVVAAEYFFNADPGEGNGIPLAVVAADCVEVTDLASLETLGPGFHTYSIRYLDDLGRWSAADGRLFYLQAAGGSEYEVRTIVAAEYFFDSDPGEGNGTALSVTQAELVDVADLASLESLEPGFHTYSIRYQDDLGRWSAADGQFFYLMPGGESNYELRTIVGAEYFFDSDPGEGNGVSFSVAEADWVTMSDRLAIGELAAGFHTLSFRYQDDVGRWSAADGRQFYLIILPERPEQPCLAGAEFYINVDPGPGLGIPLLPEDGVWDEPEETISVRIPDIPSGKHLIGLRFQDSAGHWSLAAADSFIVEPILTIRISGGDAVLDWISVEEATTFHVLRSSTSESGFAEIGTTADTFYVDPGVLSTDNRMFYQVTRDLGGPETTFRLPDRDHRQDTR